MNLLFITTDQQRHDTLPCYGLDFIQTPNLDRLATEGLVFDNAIVPAPICVACRAALLTGQYPSTIGTGSGANAHNLPVWSARLGTHGRKSAAIGKMHFNPFDHSGGFTERIIAEDKRHMYLPDDHVAFLRENGYERLHPTEKPRYYENIGASVTPRPKQFHIDAFVGDQAADWLEKNSTEPFAAWVSFPGPHDPYDPPEDMAEMYYDAPIPDPIRPPTPEELAKRPKQQGQGFDRRNSAMYRYNLNDATPEHHRLWRAHYYANISLIDEGVGKMIAALESTNALDDTLIVFTSDHGDALGDHGLCLKSFFYDCMVHVPLLMRGPGVPAGQRHTSFVSLIDLVPLFYRTCEIDVPNTVAGKDLSPILADPTATYRDHVVSEMGGRAMVQTHDWKYAHYGNGDAELFDLNSDPQECINLAGESKYQAEEHHLRGLLLEHHFQQQRFQGKPFTRPSSPYLRAAIDDFEKERAK